MKKFIFLFISIFTVSSTYAMLPPLYHTLNEIKGILSDERLAQELGSAEGITKIEKNDEGYLITTYRYQLQVDVHYIPQKLIGNPKFELKFYEKTLIQPTPNQNNENDKNSIKENIKNYPAQ